MTPSATRHRCALAAANNVAWYEAMFRAHRIPAQTLPLVWRSDHPAPPFHANLVVRSPRATQAEIEPHLRALEKALGPRAWSMKDSFCCLDAPALGLRVLFEAQWIWRDADAPVVGGAGPLHWSRVVERHGLARWEAAWAGHEQGSALAGRARQFPDALLSDPDIAFFAGRSGSTIQAGGIANRSPGAVGLSNVFAPPEFAISAWTGLLGCIRDGSPGLPIVGYERGEALRLATAVGFHATGPLRILIHGANAD